MKELYLAVPFRTKRARTLMVEKGLSMDADFDELFEDVDENWHDKAKRLQARRWRRIKKGLD